MRQNYILSYDNLRNAEGIIFPAVSGLMTGIAAGADVYGLVNMNLRPIIISAIRIRWVTKTAFTVAQSMAFRLNKVYSFTVLHATGGKLVQGHYKYQEGVTGTAPSGRVDATEARAYVSATGAVTGGTYQVEDPDEPEVYAVGAGNLSPGVFDDWIPIDGLPIVLPQFTGLVVNNDVAMGAGGVGSLFVGVDAYRFSA